MPGRKTIEEGRKALEAAKPVDLAEQRKKRGKLPAGGKGVPAAPDTGRLFARPEDGLPRGCPVTPLGKDGDVFYFLDALNQLRAVEAGKMGQAGIACLFSPRIDFLYDWHPAFDKQGDVRGWKAEKIRDDLMTACARQGVFDPLNKVRGRGAWLGEDGHLVLHFGDSVLVKGEEREWGWIGEHIYPRGAALPKPHPGRQAPEGRGGPGGELVKLLRSWRFARGETDVRLAAGWIGAAMLGGAIDWRPVCFLVGDAATGKSTLQKLLQRLFGDALLDAADTSAAGVYQAVKQDSLPVAIDELEAEADSSKVLAVVRLARLAASGAKMLRGGAEHKGTSFRAQSCFLFSAVNNPPLRHTDLTRMAVLNLRRLTDGARPPDIAPAKMAELGAKLLRRLMDQWPRYEATLQAWRSALEAEGHTGRGCDTFGTLLACADLLLYDHEPDADTLGEWAEKLKPDGLAELEGATPNWRRCLEHILTARLDVYRGGTRKTVASYLEKFEDPDADLVETREVLATVGMAVVSPEAPELAGHRWLAVANTNEGLRELFYGTDWHGQAGEVGVWKSALRQMPRGTRAVPNWVVRPAKIGGVGGLRCTLVRLGAIKDLDVTSAGPDDGEE